VEEIGDPLVRFALFRRGVTVSRRDRSESDELGEFGDRLEQGAARRAKAGELGRLSRNVEARSAGLALVVGHHTPFDHFHGSLYMKRMSRNVILERVSSSKVPSWSFLTNHARVLLCIAQDPGVRLR
jgi:hypothetical protein